MKKGSQRDKLTLELRVRESEAEERRRSEETQSGYNTSRVHRNCKEVGARGEGGEEAGGGGGGEDEKKTDLGHVARKKAWRTNRRPFGALTTRGKSGSLSLGQLGPSGTTLIDPLRGRRMSIEGLTSSLRATPISYRDDGRPSARDRLH